MIDCRVLYQDILTVLIAAQSISGETMVFAGISELLPVQITQSDPSQILSSCLYETCCVG
jgi:hypothetical protein